MCTLTYIPTGKNTFFWTQNRDESPLRTSPGLNTEHANYVYPKEPLSGGTWIGMTKNNRVISLLNGAFEQTPYVPSSKRSRGLIVLDFLEFPTPVLEIKNFEHYFEQYDLQDIEPFTMVLYEGGNLVEFRWDKKQRYLKKIDAQKPYIWSSATLYSNDAKTLRQSWFEDYLKQQKSHTQETILHFHQNAGIGDKKNDLIMDRGMVKTVSITNIAKTENALKMEYYDLVNGGTNAFEYLVIS